MDVIFVGWDRSVPGREHITSEHFGEILGYLAGMQQEELIHSFEPVLLVAHGGDLNGFLLIRGEREHLSDLMAREDWQLHVIRAGVHLEGLGIITGLSGESTMEWMTRWNSVLPG
jgi:hypothetical protein